MKTPREVAHAVVVERYAVGPRCGGEMCCGWCDCATAAIKADRAARDASLRAEADEAWRALEDIGYEHHDGKRYSTVNGEFCCGVCLRPVSMCDRRCAGKGEDWCAGHIARAALALRSREMPAPTPDPKKGPTP